ncbi:MAG: hypothetical protein ACFFCI_02295 [Promethearchaeota archaeon]
MATNEKPGLDDTLEIHEQVREIFVNAKKNKWDLHLRAPHYKTGYKGNWDYQIDEDLIAIIIYEGAIGEKDVMVFYRLIDISLEIGKKELVIIDISAKLFESYFQTLEDKRRYLRL